jgi:hypothetical protein
MHARQVHRIMKLYPLFADLSDRAVLVLGGGTVAERKIATLLGAQAQVTVNAPALTPRLRRWVSEGRIAHRLDAFQDSWLDRVWLVVAATSDREMNTQVATLAGLRRIFVNVVDDAALSSFHVPAVVDRAPLMIAISSGGEAPSGWRRCSTIHWAHWRVLRQDCVIASGHACRTWRRGGNSTKPCSPARSLRCCAVGSRRRRCKQPGRRWRRCPRRVRDRWCWSVPAPAIQAC